MSTCGGGVPGFLRRRSKSSSVTPRRKIEPHQSLTVAEPTSTVRPSAARLPRGAPDPVAGHRSRPPSAAVTYVVHALSVRSEEHTSELQSHSDLVCRLLLEKKNK